MRHNDERLLATHWPENGVAPLLLRLRGIRGLPAGRPTGSLDWGVARETERETESEGFGELSIGAETKRSDVKEVWIWTDEVEMNL